MEMKEEEKQKEQTERHKSVKELIYVHFCKYNSKWNCSFDSILTHFLSGFYTYVQKGLVVVSSESFYIGIIVGLNLTNTYRIVWFF